MAAGSIRFELLEHKLFYGEDAGKHGSRGAIVKNQFRVKISGIGAAAPEIVFLFPIGDFQGCLTSDTYAEAIRAESDGGAAPTKERDESGNLLFRLSASAPSGPRGSRKIDGEAAENGSPGEEEAVTVTFRDIVTYPFDGEDMSMTPVEIRWNQGGGERREVLRLYLLRGSLAISFFTSDTEHVCAGDTVALSWSSAGADRCQIGPYGDAADAAGAGVFPVYEDTEFVFRIFKGECSVCRSIFVYADKKVESVSLAAAPEGLVKFGVEAEFAAGFAPARHAFISGGVGRVEQGSVKWKPYSRGLPYVLSCVSGGGETEADIKRASVMTGMENALQVRSMTLEPMGGNKCYLYWNVYCADKVDVLVNGESVAESKPAAGDLTFSCKQIAGTVVTLVCRGAGQELTRSVRMV